MTANQIAYAANQETHRHNEVDEGIRERANDINAERNRLEQEYRDKALNLDAQYKQLQYDLDKAQGDRKLDIQEQLAWIEFKKQTADADYKAQMVRINEQQTAINKTNSDELIRYQTRLNELGFAKNEIDAQLANLRERQIEYENASRRDQLTINELANRIELQKANQEYSLGLIRAENEQVRNELQAEVQKYQEGTMIANSVWNGVASILSLGRAGRNQ